MRGTELKTNHMKSPMGIDGGRVVLSWIPVDGNVQKAFRVRVYCGDGLIFDSGKVLSGKTEYVPDCNIANQTEVRWDVTLWDENDCAGECGSACFETGIGKDSWQARWISPEECGVPRILYASDPLNRAGYLKRTFTVEKTTHARLYITAHGIYDAWINGRHVDGYFMAPGTSQYNKRLQVQTYDVADLLIEGENEIVVTLGDGWYRGCLGWPMRRNSFGTRLALLCQLEADGEAVLVTDGEWQVSQNGPLGLNDMMQLEEYDANRVINDWHPAFVLDYPLDNLIGSCLPIVPKERFKATKIITPRGEVVLDFGQNIAGYAELDVEAKGGEKISLTFIEVLDKDGNFQSTHNQNPDYPYCTQKLEYICKPGRNVYHQMKCYYGFRYVKVETELEITGEEFTAAAVYSDMEQTGYFECGNPDVNKLFENCVWSMKGNFVDVPTDCPHREKCGFTGDLQVFSGTAMYLMDCYPVIARWLKELAATQGDDGCIKQMAPDMGYDRHDGAAGWCDAFEIVPWRIMKLYDSDVLLAELYPYIREWMYYCIARARSFRESNADMPRIYRDYFVDVGLHWGEWHEPGRTPYDYDMDNWTEGLTEVATAYLAYGCRLAGDLADRLGETYDRDYFRDVAEKARNTYRYAFLKDGRIESDRQCHFVRPLEMGLLNEDEHRQAAADLVALVKKQGGIGTGFLSTYALCDVLTDNGYSSIAYDLLLNRKQPSWLYEVEKGATTVWESWNGISADGTPEWSLNHYSYGTVAGWLMSRVAGITVEGNHITVRPYPDSRLGFARGEYRSPVGTVISRWTYEDDRIRFEVKIPPNTEGCVILPSGETYTVKNGQHTFYCEKE